MPTRGQSSGSATPGDDDANLRFHRIEWRIHRTARIVFLVILAAALLGLFGDGPLANTRLEADGLQLEYDHFVREEASLAITADGSHGPLELDVIDLVRQDELSLIPPGARVETLGDRHLRIVPPPGSSGVQTVRIHWQPEEPGLRRGRIESRGRGVHAWIWVYP